MSLMQRAKDKMQGAQAMPQDQAPQGTQVPYKTPVNKVLPPDLQLPFQKLVEAGRTIMYSEQMRPEIQKIMQDPKPIEQKLPEGIRGLMGLMAQQSKGQIPPQIVIPAAIELLHDAADFLQQAGMAELTPEQMTDATQYLVVLLAKGAGASDEQVMGIFEQQGQQPNAQLSPEMQQGGMDGGMMQGQQPMGA